MEQELTQNANISRGDLAKALADVKSLKSHMHEYSRQGNYFICNCGKKILAFEQKEDEDIKVGIRSNHRKYTKKNDNNRFFMPKEWIKFEDKLSPFMRHTCKCLLFTGARIMELQHVKVNDFIYDPKGRSILILRVTKTKARKGEFGSGKPRKIPLSKSFAKYLADFIKNNELELDDNLVTHTNGAINQAVKKTARKIGLSHPEDISAHTFRKTLETWLMALGADTGALVAHFGHDLATAVKSYISADIFSGEDKNLMRQIIGDIYERRREY